MKLYIQYRNMIYRIFGTLKYTLKYKTLEEAVDILAEILEFKIKFILFLVIS